MPKHYKYRKFGLRRPEKKPVKAETGFPAGREQLTGQVQGKKAGPEVERLAIAMREYPKISFFKYSVLVVTPFQQPGEFNEVDFMVYVGNWVYPIEVDGEFTHKSPEQKAYDRYRDQVLNPIIKKKWWGARDITRIPGSKLGTIEDARRVIRSII
jgi:hypothetical protein